jgi:2-keto-4-pentenoate hydratase/2-oxohepta-3-ene-1,7-dioic acid hydratase in catechol pathway
VDVPSFPGCPEVRVTRWTGASSFCGADVCGYAAAPLTPAPTAPLLARYRVHGAACYGLLVGTRLHRLTAPPWMGGTPTGDEDAVDGAQWLPPCEPTKIVCVGLNYVEHVRESLTVATDLKEVPPEPLLFLKPPSSALAHGGTIRYPQGVTRLDPEGELAVVIGRRACCVPEAEALEYVAGVTCFNDVSARNYQKSDGQWARAKGFDTFAPFGPVIALGLPPGDLALETRVNGQARQHARTSAMHFKVPFLVHHISKIMTLEPGDVIATGTPAGIAPIVPGDVVEVELEGVGVLANTVGAFA